MVRLGITGHQELSAGGDWTWVRSELRKVIAVARDDVIGFSSLAVGADQVFANEVLSAGGAIVVVVPFPEYADRYPAGAERQAYLALRDSARDVWVLPRVGDDRACYLLAGKVVVENCDRLLAVWDGEGAKGEGGTGDIVAYAVGRGKSVTWLDPYGRRVTKPT